MVGDSELTARASYTGVADTIFLFQLCRGLFPLVYRKLSLVYLPLNFILAISSSSVLLRTRITRIV